MSETIKQPYWNRLVEECKNKIEKKFKEYENSWEYTTDSEFWKKRLQDEVNELKEKLWQFPDELKVMKECVDVINICAMIYSIQAKRYHDWVNDGGR